MNVQTKAFNKLVGKFVVVETDEQLALGTLTLEGDEIVTRTGLRGRPVRFDKDDVTRIVLAELHPDAVVVV